MHFSPHREKLTNWQTKINHQQERPRVSITRHADHRLLSCYRLPRLVITGLARGEVRVSHRYWLVLPLVFLAWSFPGNSVGNWSWSPAWPLDWSSGRSPSYWARKSGDSDKSSTWSGEGRGSPIYPSLPFPCTESQRWVKTLPSLVLLTWSVIKTGLLF